MSGCDPSWRAHTTWNQNHASEPPLGLLGGLGLSFFCSTAVPPALSGLGALRGVSYDGRMLVLVVGWFPRWIASSLQAGTVSCSQRHPRTLACGWDMLAGTREALDKRWMVVMTHQKKLRMEDSKEALSPDRRHSLTAETPLCPQLSVCIL
ncbi:unnamed protein product [Rangifer tarandus platyrhynchus]|uniref:Uncharacterized protein n=2 Tax=Rangifer tarandus platyrhynchus TaxID=3082113 RepID=A0ABN9A3V7_RANTA|nr:unnamed protein product [Rangifer tarandus platyrhynchus]